MLGILGQMELERTIDELRTQLRWTWGHLGCRCIFNDHDEKIMEEAHCPVHGWYEVASKEVS